MSNDDILFDQDSLDSDNNFDSPLRRVSFQAGMLLGVEATQSEQDYHRRRLIRHQYWFHGYGTLLGMAITIEGDERKDGVQDKSLSIHVSPGIGIDGLGREVMIHESYCINLSDWISTQDEAALAPGVDRDDDEDLRLIISVRYQDCASSLQPTMASRLNDSTDPVSPSRIGDSILLEIVASRTDDLTQPWLAHELPLNDSQDSKFTPAEVNALNQLPEGDKILHTQQARLVYALTRDAEAQAQPGLSSARDAEDAARIPLAELRISNVNDLGQLDDKIYIKNIHVNNLIRPFIHSNAQIARRISL